MLFDLAPGKYILLFFGNQLQVEFVPRSFLTSAVQELATASPVIFLRTLPKSSVPATELAASSDASGFLCLELAADDKFSLGRFQSGRDLLGHEERLLIAHEHDFLEFHFHVVAL